MFQKKPPVLSKVTLSNKVAWLILLSWNEKSWLVLSLEDAMKSCPGDLLVYIKSMVLDWTVDPPEVRVKAADGCPPNRQEFVLVL